MHAAVAIIVAVVGPVEILLLNGDIGYVLHSFTLERIVLHHEWQEFVLVQISRTKQMDFLDLADLALADVDIEQVIELVQGHSSAPHLLLRVHNGAFQLSRVDDVDAVRVYEVDLVLQNLVTVANVELLVLEIVGGVRRPLQARYQGPPIAERPQRASFSRLKDFYVIDETGLRMGASQKNAIFDQCIHLSIHKNAQR